MLGSVQTLVVCKPSAVTVSPCPSGQEPIAVSAYVLDPAAGPWMEGAAAPLDLTVALELWAAAIALIVFSYVMAWAAKAIMKVMHT